MRSARTAGEGGRGRERAKERVVRGVRVRAFAVGTASESELDRVSVLLVL